MIILLSSSKRLSFNGLTEIKYGEEPYFIKDSKKLIRLMKKFNERDLTNLMSISHKLAENNYLWFQEWDHPFNMDKARPAFASFTGDVYDGIKSWELSPTQVEIADSKIRILSGLYGVLRPTDIILPYRLEMGTQLKSRDFNNLYDFWRIKLTNYLIKELRPFQKKVIINLASIEYSKALNFHNMDSTVVTPFFLEFINGDYKFISINAKRARGRMIRYIIDKNIDDVEHLKLFDYDGYSYDDQQSINNRWVFTR